MTFRFHVVGLPYAPICKRYSACAFTARAYKFAQMMMDRGHEVFTYGVEGSDAPATGFKSFLTKAEHHVHFGDEDATKVGYTSKPCIWNPDELCWQETNVRAAYWIGKNLQKGDFVCIIGGSCQKQIVDLLAGQKEKFLTVEYCVGYLGPFAPHQVFESYAAMHQMYGRQSGHLVNGCDGRNFDAVIPGSYDLNDFTFQPKPQDYCLFMGRIIKRKGVDVAVEATRHAKMNLIVCGQGANQVEGSPIYANDGEAYIGHHLDYVGVADTAKRNELMGNAKALLCPSAYLEPFGGVNVEAQLCGTPVISTDWGAFPETVEHGKTGFRCRTLEQFVWAVSECGKLDRAYISERARRLYSLERIGAMYEEYFAMLSTLWGKGWYAERERTQLDWLKGAS